MVDLEMRDVVNRWIESDLDGALQMGIPQTQAAKQNVPADKKRGVVFIRAIGDADRVAHVTARLIH